MFGAWIKGIFASILIFFGVIIIGVGVFAMDDVGSSSIIYMIVGGGFTIIGSYFKFVSKQSVRKASDTTKPKSNQNLIECPACSSMISKNADSCIKCGEPINK